MWILPRSLSTTSKLPVWRVMNEDAAERQETLKKKLAALERQIDDVLVHLETSHKESHFIPELYDIKASLLATVPYADQLDRLALEFSFDPSDPVNGYATLVDFFHRAIDRTSVLVKYLQSKRSGLRIQFTASPSLKVLKAWATLISYLSKAAETCVDIVAKHSKENLFVELGQLTDDEKNKVKKSLYAQDLYGRTLAFQYEESYAYYVTALTVAFAGYAEVASQWNHSVAQTAASLFSMPKYVLNPELRSKQVVQVIHDADIQFCKNIWSVTETEMFHLRTSLAQSDVLINVCFQIEHETATGKRKTSVKLMSHELFEGMADSPEIKQQCKHLAKKKASGQSNALLFHIHGGGFIAMSPKSHEIYLRPWARVFKIPILSVDYGLCPENTFPAPLDDCVSAYNWAFENKSKLGWTGEKIVLVGDSAGGQLVAALTLHQIMNGLRKPDEICLFYPVLFLKLVVSPARIISALDLFINCELSLRYAAAYVGIPARKTDDGEKEKDRRRSASAGSCTTTITDCLFDRFEQCEEMLSNPCISPLSASDDLVRQMPVTHLWCGTCDPALDDSIQMALRLKKLGKPCTLKTFKRTPHGFLNMQSNTTCYEAFTVATNQLAEIIAKLKAE